MMNIKVKDIEKNKYNSMIGSLQYLTHSKPNIVNDIEIGNEQPASSLSKMVHFLHTRQCPPRLDRAKCRYFRLQFVPYVLINDILFRKDHSGMMLRCIDNDHLIKSCLSSMADL